MKNRKELEVLAKWGENPRKIDGLTFNQGNWHKETSCGTSACMIGTLLHLCPYTTLRASDDTGDALLFDFLDIANYFDVTFEQTEYMFDIEYDKTFISYEEWSERNSGFDLEYDNSLITPQMVAARIRHVLEIQDSEG